MLDIIKVDYRITFRDIFGMDILGLNRQMTDEREID